MQQYSTTLAQIETQLADNDLYLAENKEKLTTLLADQAELKKKLRQVENDWLTQAGIIGRFSVGGIVFGVKMGILASLHLVSNLRQITHFPTRTHFNRQTGLLASF